MGYRCLSCGSSDYKRVANDMVCSYCGYKRVDKEYIFLKYFLGLILFFIIATIFLYQKSNINDNLSSSSKVKRDKLSKKENFPNKIGIEKTSIKINNKDANIAIQNIEYDTFVKDLSINNERANIKIQNIKKSKQDNASYNEMIKTIAYMKSVKDPKKQMGKKRVFYKDGHKITIETKPFIGGRVTKKKEGYFIDNNGIKYDKQSIYHNRVKNIKYFSVTSTNEN
jgi:hypothetical protein